MDFTFLVQNIITKYMTNLDEKGYEEPRKIVFDGLYNDLQYVYRCGQLSINTGIKQDLKPEPRSWSVKMPEIPQPDHEQDTKKPYVNPAWIPGHSCDCNGDKYCCFCHPHLD